nr:hypothetical protein [Blastocatellia bacterium]
MKLRSYLPSFENVGLALLAAVLLILAFPDFELWFLAWFALVPLLWAIERQSHCVYACALLGWIFGTAFFFGTCWWLTYAPIHYAAMPWPLAYFLIFTACLGAGIFPAIFAAILAILLRRFGSWAFLAAPFVWVFSEFLRYWMIGNNWNAIGYSQAFTFSDSSPIILIGNLTCSLVRVGGLLSAGFLIVLCNSSIALSSTGRSRQSYILSGSLFFVFLLWMGLYLVLYPPMLDSRARGIAATVAIQPNVPMSGMDSVKSDQYRNNQVKVAEAEIKSLNVS